MFEKSTYNELFSRFITLDWMNQGLLDKIQSTTFGIFGTGGLGSWSSLLLSKLGAKLLLVDRDNIELSNLPRTAYYGLSDVGKPKVATASNYLKGFYPNLDITVIQTEITQDNISNLVNQVDIVIDGLDNFATRAIVNKQCLVSKIPYIFAGATAMEANLSSFTYQDDHFCLECLFSNIDDQSLPSNRTHGVHIGLLATVASIQVQEALRMILGLKPILDKKLLYFYYNSYEIDVLELSGSRNCPHFV